MHSQKAVTQGCNEDVSAKQSYKYKTAYGLQDCLALIVDRSPQAEHIFRVLQDQLLSIDDIQSQIIFASPGIGQCHPLNGSEITLASPTFETPTLSNLAPLTASDLTLGNPSLENPTIGQIQALSATDILIVGIYENPSIGQVHALTASDISAQIIFEAPTVFDYVYSTERTITIAAENRIYTIDAESRNLAIESENRTVVIEETSITV